jgi:hypothetical protein
MSDKLKRRSVAQNLAILGHAATNVEGLPALEAQIDRENRIPHKKHCMCDQCGADRRAALRAHLDSR